MDQIFPFRINDRDLLWDFRLWPFTWRYTSRNFEILNTWGPLIWNALGISTTDKIQPVCLYFKPEMSCSACCARMLPMQTTNLDDLLPLKSICDNIWIHMGWNAPCKLPRTSSSSRLLHWAMESCSKNILLRNKIRQAHYPKNKKKTHGFQEEIIYVHKPKLTDFYKALGESKLPP
jgi:hypothetical protein